MTDCGATGSALDRTARAVLGGAGGNNNDASKQLASFMGHTVASNALARQSLPPMPMAAPDRLLLPLPEGDSLMMRQSNASRMDNRGGGGGAIHGAVMASADPRTNMSMPSQQHRFVQKQQQHVQQHQYAQQHQQHSMMQMQHQQQMAAAQHHQMMQQQQQSQQQLQFLQAQQQQQAYSKNAQHPAGVPDHSDQWHDGLEEHAKEELRRHLETLQDDATVAGHEGLVSGATIEELSAAWAQSEAEFDQIEAATNMWNSTGQPASKLDQQAAPYEFVNTADTPHAPQDWMEQGMREFQAGNLKEAIYAFEMELQHSNSDNATAWRMLGRCHAENDMDRQAIVCLEQAVDRDPYSPEALLALGVSYVNELNHARAIETLQAWIQNNPKFAGLELQDDLYGAAESNSPEHSGNMESAFDNVQQLLLRALEYDPTDSADVLEALGVIYNVSRDYDAAVDAFQRAIEARPDDYQLWNKLGATLANGNQSEKALPAYQRALQLKPKYARVWLNMAISHSNLQNYQEAARCYLQTLSLNPSAVHCWSYLRIALSCSERWDLLPLAAAQDLKPFAELFDFVVYSSNDAAAAPK